MGTSVDIPTLKREWRTVLCATVGMAAAILDNGIDIDLSAEFSVDFGDEGEAADDKTNND